MQANNKYTLAVTPKVVFGKREEEKTGALVGLLVGERSGTWVGQQIKEALVELLREHVLSKSTVVGKLNSHA
jgi:hypothetical protein